MSNYTEEQKTKMSEIYQAAETQEDRDEAIKYLAEEFGTTVPSIRATLVNMKIYQKKRYLTKSNTVPCTKDTLVTKIEEYFDVYANRFESLTKANKTVLVYIMREIVAKCGDEEGIFEGVL